MKISLIINKVLFCCFLISIFFAITVHGQKIISKNLKFLTVKFAGKYSFSTNINMSRDGTILIFPETDTTLLFYVELQNGAPAFDQGALYGRVKIINDTGIFYKKSEYSDNGCKWTMKFFKNKLIIRTVDRYVDCDGFGGNVVVDGVYKKLSSRIPQYFITPEFKKVFFKKVKPDDYEK